MPTKDAERPIRFETKLFRFVVGVPLGLLTLIGIVLGFLSVGLQAGWEIGRKAVDDLYEDDNS